MIKTRYFIMVVPFLGGSSKIKPSPLFDKLYSCYDVYTFKTSYIIPDPSCVAPFEAFPTRYAYLHPDLKLNNTRIY